jgi:hypothetical protein
MASEIQMGMLDRSRKHAGGKCPKNPGSSLAVFPSMSPNVFTALCFGNNKFEIKQKKLKHQRFFF